jgi:hypothetical protein
MVEIAVHFADELRKQAIGEPVWVPDKHVYEYSDESPKVAAVLKPIRMAEGVVALNMLRVNGLFVDRLSLDACTTARRKYTSCLKNIR